MPATFTVTEATFARAATRSSAIFEGEVVAIERAPGSWSGVVAAYQPVTYRIAKIIADRDKRLSVGEQITVHHVIVDLSATADSKPQLRPDLVTVGATVIVLAEWSDDRWTGIDEHHGVVPSDDAHRVWLMRR